MNHFSHNNYFIEEKVNLFKFNNAYKVFESNGHPIAVIMGDWIYCHYDWYGAERI